MRPRPMNGSPDRPIVRNERHDRFPSLRRTALHLGQACMRILMLCRGCCVARIAPNRTPGATIADPGAAKRLEKAAAESSRSGTRIFARHPGAHALAARRCSHDGFTTAFVGCRARHLEPLLEGDSRPCLPSVSVSRSNCLDRSVQPLGSGAGTTNRRSGEVGSRIVPTWTESGRRVIGQARKDRAGTRRIDGE